VASTARSTDGGWSDEPVIAPVGVVPNSIRASVAAPPASATASPGMTTAPPPDRPATPSAKAPGATIVGPASTAPGAMTTGAPVEEWPLDRGGPAGRRAAGRHERRGAGALVADVATDLSTLVRKEVELAKAEVRQSAVRAGKGAGMLGGAVGVGVYAVLFLLLAAMFGLATFVGLAAAALIIGAILAVTAAILAVMGRANVKKTHPKPEQTVETLKEDMQWAHGLRK
jgi:hypothetical protein